MLHQNEWCYSEKGSGLLMTMLYQAAKRTILIGAENRMSRNYVV